MPHNSKHTLLLESLLVSSHELMQQLLHLLKNETSFLKENDIEKLSSVTLEKISLTEQVEQSEKKRIDFLTKLSLNPTEPSQWLSNNKLISLWTEIKNLSAQAQKQNQINGLVINGNRRRIQAQLDILSASSPAVELTYSASGENIKQRDSNSLAHV